MTTIRHECLRPAESWVRPTGQEISEVLRLASITGGKASKKLGLQDSRTIRKWIGEDSEIPYAAWALLCDIAGLGIIWRDKTDENLLVIPESPPTPEQVKQIREHIQAVLDLGITKAQKHCADLLRKGLRTWQQWENGDREMDPALYVLVKIKITQLNLVKNS